jgi:hypothetical protein
MYYKYKLESAGEGLVKLEEECVIPEQQTGIITIKKIPMKIEDAISKLEKQKADRARQLLFHQTQMAAEVESIDAVLLELKKP